MGRVSAVLYGLFSYAVFLVSFLYAVGFIADLWVPKTIDSGGGAPLVPALVTDIALLTLFAMQHSVMARPSFKRWWMRYVPQSVERSTYVLAASLVLLLMFWQWQPLLGRVWAISGPSAAIVWGLYALGWVVVLVSTFFISHAHLFGIQQIFDHWRGHAPKDPAFQLNGLYRHVRHPIMLGFVIAFWSAPEMSWGRLLFAVASTGYILIALQFEEQDLIASFGSRYREYKAHVPMLVPRLRRAAVRKADVDATQPDRGLR